MPRTPDDLAQHNCVRLLEYADLRAWPFEGPTGVRTIEVRGQHTANNAETVLQMALAGLGIIRLVDVMLGAEPGQRPAGARCLPTAITSNRCRCTC